MSKSFCCDIQDFCELIFDVSKPVEHKNSNQKWAETIYRKS